MNKFSGASAISSAQYFGEKESTKSKIDYYESKWLVLCDF